jgi:DNA/RNA-binding domain of Phe-tRNA-synthetase-like protein
MNIPKINVYDEIHALNIDVNFIIFQNIQNKKSDESFDVFQQQVLSELTSTLSKEQLKNDPVLEGYRDLRTAVGLSRSKNVCSSEALLNYLLKKQTLPQINLLVNIYNMLSVKTHISIGAHNLDSIDQYMDFRLTNGNEKFIPMGETESVEIKKGEYAYIDGSDEILCRLDYRQCNKTKITEDTQSCLFIVQGNPNTNKEEINIVTEELVKLVNQFCGSEAVII